MTNFNTKRRYFYRFPSSLREALNVIPFFQVCIYLPFFLVEFNGFSLVLTLIVHILFMPLLFFVFWQTDKYTALPLLTMTALSFILSFYSFSALVFFGFTALACSAILNRKYSYFAVVGVTLVFIISAYLNVNSIYIWFVGLFLTLVNGLNVVYQLNKYRENRLLTQSHDEVRSLAATAERERIARDLHDLLGQSLTSISLKAELSEKLLDVDPQQAKQHIYEIRLLAREALTNVRETVSDYKLSSLENELASTRIALDAREIELLLHLSDFVLCDEVESVLAMTVREATTNILRHSCASQVIITLKQNNHSMFLSIQDNGKPCASVKIGNGLQGMIERFAAMEGELTITANHGFLIQGTLPMAVRNR